MLIARFTCNGCGLVRATVNLPEREPNETPEAWMDRVKLAVTNQHSFLRPGCTSKTAAELLIPTVGRTRLGGPVIN